MKNGRRWISGNQNDLPCGVKLLNHFFWGGIQTPCCRLAHLAHRFIKKETSLPVTCWLHFHRVVWFEDLAFYLQWFFGSVSWQWSAICAANWGPQVALGSLYAPCQRLQGLFPFCLRYKALFTANIFCRGDEIKHMLLQKTYESFYYCRSRQDILG